MINCRLKVLLAERGLTQKRLAEQIGLTPQYLSQIAGDHQWPGREVVERICDRLDCRVGDLFVFAKEKEMGQ